MQGKVVDRTAHRRVGDRPLAAKGGIAGAEGPLARVNELLDGPIETDQRVVADLVLIAGMGRAEGVERRLDPEHRLVQHHQPRARVQRIAESIVAMALAVVAGIDHHPLGTVAQPLQQGQQPLAQLRVGPGAVGLQRRHPGHRRRRRGCRPGTGQRPTGRRRQIEKVEQGGTAAGAAQVAGQPAEASQGQGHRRQAGDQQRARPRIAHAGSGSRQSQRRRRSRAAAGAWGSLCSCHWRGCGASGSSSVKRNRPSRA